MRTKMSAAVVALLAGALTFPNQEALARNCGGGGFGKAATCSSNRTGMKGWIDLHRPDGEVVRIKINQIVFVMSATNTGADKRAHSKVQLLNGSMDVLEGVDEVTQAITNDDSFPSSGLPNRITTSTNRG
jgi:hypothetical protein